MFQGELIRSPAKGQDFELAVRDAQLHSAAVCGHSDGTYPIQGRPKLEVSQTFWLLTCLLVPPRASAPQKQNQHRKRRPAREKQSCFRHSPVLPVPRLPVRPHAHHHRLRLRRCGRDVPGHDPAACSRRAHHQGQAVDSPEDSQDARGDQSHRGREKEGGRGTTG